MIYATTRGNLLAFLVTHIEANILFINSIIDIIFFKYKTQFIMEY